MMERTKTKMAPATHPKSSIDETEKAAVGIGPIPIDPPSSSVLAPVASEDQRRICDLERRLASLEGVGGRVGVHGTRSDTNSVVIATFPKKDDDEEDSHDEFLRYSSGDVPSPIRHPPRPPTPPPAATSSTTKKAIDPMDVDTPPAVDTDYYDANDPTCPRPSAPPLEMLMEDGYYDESLVTSSPTLTPDMGRRSIDNEDYVAACRPPPPSRTGDGLGARTMGGLGGAGMGMVVDEAEWRGDRQRSRTVGASSGWVPAPSHPPRSTNAAAAAGVCPQLRSDAAATRPVPFARARVIGDIDVAVCEAVPMMTAPPPASAPAPAQYQYQYNGEERAGWDGGMGMNDELPRWSITCGGVVRIICLMSLGLVAVCAIIATVAFVIGSKQQDDPPIPFDVSTSTSSTIIATDTVSMDAMAATLGTVPMSESTGTGSTLDPTITTTSAATISTPTTTEITAAAMTTIASTASTAATSTAITTTSTVRTTTSTSSTTTTTTGATTSSTTTSTTTTPIITTVAVSSPSWKQQGVPIEGDGAGDLLGGSVALSGDASILAIGARGYNNFTGYVKVFLADDDGRNWVQLGQTIFGGNDYDDFGYSIGITPDGMTIICGSPQYSDENYDSPGYVKVFTLEGDSSLGTDIWKQIGRDIIGESYADYFGFSVAISDDGETVAVGAIYSDGINKVNSGHVGIYRLVDDDGGSWEQIGQDIDGEAANYEIGSSVSLSADGSTVAIGAAVCDYNGHNAGQVTVYRYDGEGSSWIRLGQSIYGYIAGDWFGQSVSLSPDGETLAIGSPGYWEDNDRPGYARVFSLMSGDEIGDANTWNQIGQDIIGNGNGDEFGWSVSLSDDGKTLGVGADTGDVKNSNNGVNSGYVRVYRMDDVESIWIQIGDDIEGEWYSDYSGWSVSLSADGSKVAIGSPGSYVFLPTAYANGEDAGHVKVFALE